MGDKLIDDRSLLDTGDGLARIERDALLTRLHYFDGKFLRADALTLEQDYQRGMVTLANLANGWGVVYGMGLDWARGAPTFGLTKGLAVTPLGTTVLLERPIEADIAKLVAAANRANDARPAPGRPGPRAAVFGNCDCEDAPAPEPLADGVYEITVGRYEKACGNEEVYGKLCEDACVTDSQRPYWREGVVLRLRRVSLALPASRSVPLVAAHLRNRIASAYFAYEPWLEPAMLSRRGLASPVWCGAAQLYGRDEVPIGLLVREGATTRFVDAWSARRELMDTQARGYWQGVMMMRPWNVFIAQILQFQCQLSTAFDPDAPAYQPRDEECRQLRELVADSVREIEIARTAYAESNNKIIELLAGRMREGDRVLETLSQPMDKLDLIREKWSQAKDALPNLVPNRLLLDSGFVELPSAGYLPVIPTRQAINLQLQRFFGEGVNLYFRAVRPDHIAHLVEEAQHMERISLVRGIDDPACKEDVEIFVPCGEVVQTTDRIEGTQWLVEGDWVSLGDVLDELASPTNGDVKKAGLRNMREGANPPEGQAMPLAGVARTARLDSGGATLTLVCGPVSRATTDIERAPPLGLYVDLRMDEDPFERPEGDDMPASFEIRLARSTARGPFANTAVGRGTLTVQSRYALDTGVEGVIARLDLFGMISKPGGTHDARWQFDLYLRREGDARAGSVRIGRQQPLERIAMTRHWTARWAGTPREALFGPVSDAGRDFVVRERVREQPDRVEPGIGAPLGGAPIGLDPRRGIGGIEFDPRRIIGGVEGRVIEQLETALRMRQLDNVLPPESRERSDAMNALVAIGEASGDGAFVSRAQRRLFPEAQGTGEILVRPKLDWVMFRRQRIVDCGQPPCRMPRVPVDVFQVWHVKLEDREQRGPFVEALDAGRDPPRALAFERVGLVHYPDGGITPSETVAQMLNALVPHKPGRQLAIARAWETAPRAGQGVQDAARLRRLADLFSGVAAPAPDLDIGFLPRVPAFAGAQAEGGMLFVTLDPPAEQTLRHRVSFFPGRDAWNRIIEAVMRSPDKAGAILDHEGLETEYVVCDGDVPREADLARAGATFRALMANGIEFVQANVAQDSPDEAHAAPEHRAICAALGVDPVGIEPMPVQDFGNGAFAMTSFIGKSLPHPPEPEAALKHRVAIVRAGNAFEDLKKQLRSDPVNAAQLIDRFSPGLELVLCDGDTPRAADLDRMKEIGRELGAIDGVAAFVVAGVAQKAHATAEHKQICAALGATPADVEQLGRATDFGDGAFAVTLVTRKEEQPHVVTHRVTVVTGGSQRFDKGTEVIETTPQDAVRFLESDNATVLVTCDGKRPRDQDLERARVSLADLAPNGYEEARGFVSATSADHESAQAEHEQICRALGVPPVAVKDAQVDDFGDGAFAVTILLPKQGAPVEGRTLTHRVYFYPTKDIERIGPLLQRDPAAALREALKTVDMTFAADRNIPAPGQDKLLQKAFDAVKAQSVSAAVGLAADEVSRDAAQVQHRIVCKLLGFGNPSAVTVVGRSVLGSALSGATALFVQIAPDAAPRRGRGGRGPR